MCTLHAETLASPCLRKVLSLDCWDDEVWYDPAAAIAPVKNDSRSRDGVRPPLVAVSRARMPSIMVASVRMRSRALVQYTRPKNFSRLVNPSDI